MKRLGFTALVFALAVAINATSVAAQRRGAYLTRRFGALGWYVHLALIAPPWLTLQALLPTAGRDVRWRLPRAWRPLGLLFLAVAGAVWAGSFRQLGAVRTANGDHFGRVPGTRLDRGLFAWLRDPMYDSYALGLAGAALASANPAYLALAVESVLLLNGVEARVERCAVPAAGSSGAVRRPLLPVHAGG